jgi:hypothetical protein
VSKAKAAETVEVDEEEQRRRFDALLADVGKDVRQERQGASLSALLGGYEAMEGHAGFYGRAPKLRQQIEIAKISESRSEAASSAENIVGAAEMARLAIFRQDRDEVRNATMNELMDEFTAEEVATVLSRYLGLNVTGDADPNPAA